jgi:hypothetical protein
MKNTKTNSHEVFTWFAHCALVLTIGGLLPLSAQAQAQNQAPGQEKATNVATIVESGPTGAATLSAKPVPEPTLPPPSGHLDWRLHRRPHRLRLGQGEHKFHSVANCGAVY